MRPISLRLRRLINARWASDATADEIAARYHISARSVVRCWRTAQAAGVLPQGPRPHFAQYCANPATAGGADAAHSAAVAETAALTIVDRYEPHERAADLRYERAAMQACHVPCGDPLLAALEQVHRGDLRRYEADEIAIDDRKASHTPAAVLAEARRRDAQTSRRMAWA